MALPTLPQRSQRVAALLLLGIWAVLWVPGLLQGRALYFRDLLSHDLQWRQEWARQVEAGELPLWQSATGGGMPLLGDPNTQALYPGTALFLAFDPRRALALFMLIHQLLLGLGAYLLLRRAGHGRCSALAGSAFAAGGGLAFSHLCYPNIAALAWAPWLAWTAVRLPPAGALRHRRLVLGGVFAALMVLAGAPILAALGFVFWAWTLLCGHIRPHHLRAGLTPTVAAGLAAPLLIPALQAFAASSRHLRGLPPGSFGADAFLPRRWPELLLPHLYGRPGWLAPDGFWAAPSFGWIRYELNLHLGAVALVLVALAAATRRGRRWIALAGLAAVIAALPGVLERAASWLPGLGALRYSIKLLVLSHLALVPAVAAGMAVARRRRRLFRWCAAGLAVPLAGTLALTASPATLRRALSAAFPASAANLAEPGVADAVAAAVRRDTVAQLLPLAAAAASPTVLLVPALAVQLAVEGSSTLMWDSWTEYARTPRLARALGYDRRLTFLVATDQLRLHHEATTLSSPRWCTRLARRQLWRFYGELDGVSYRGTTGPDGMEPWWVADCAARLLGSPPDRLAHLARQLGSAWVLRDTPLPAGADIAATSQVTVMGEPIVLHRLRAPMPSAWLARRALTEPWRGGAWAQLENPAVEPGRDAVLVGPHQGVRHLGGGSAAVRRADPGVWTVEVDSAGPGLLVVDQAYSPAWRALVDGAPAATVVVNLWQLGIPLSEGGHHVVRLEVNSRPFFTGLLLAGLTALLALLLLVRGARGSRRSPRGAAAPTPRATPPAP